MKRGGEVGGGWWIGGVEVWEGKEKVLVVLEVEDCWQRTY